MSSFLRSKLFPDIKGDEVAVGILEACLLSSQEVFVYQRRHGTTNCALGNAKNLGHLLLSVNAINFTFILVQKSAITRIKMIVDRKFHAVVHKTENGSLKQ